MPVPEKIGDRYEVIEQIGQGGQALIYRALDKHMEREVAVKAAPFPRGGRREENDAILEKFRHEIIVAGRLNHPGVVQVYDYGLDEERETAYMVMQLLDGKTIKELLADEGPPPPKDALRIMGALIRTLYYLHENQVVHRDLKPSNVFIMRGDPVIIDFGVSSSREQTVTLTTAGITGSQPYICPEIINPRTVQEYRRHPRRDVWGLGMIGFELCTGGPYFDPEADAGEIAGLLSNTGELLKDLGRRMGQHPLAPLVLKILRSEEIRPEWAREAEELTAALSRPEQDPPKLPGAARTPYVSELGARMMVTTPDPSVEIPEEHTRMYCMICSKPVWSYQTECPHCGAERLFARDPKWIPTPDEPQINFWDWAWDKMKLVITALAVLGLIVLFLGMLFSLMEQLPG